MKNELTPRQKEAMALLLIRIGSWTSARWTSHLRNMIGDEDAEPLIAWVSAPSRSVSSRWPSARTGPRSSGTSCGRITRVSANDSDKAFWRTLAVLGIVWTVGWVVFFGWAAGIG